MRAHRTAKYTPFNPVLTDLPPSATLPEPSDRPGTIPSDECLASLLQRGEYAQRLSYAMKKAGHDKTAVQRKYNKNFGKKEQFRVKVQPGAESAALIEWNCRPAHRIQRRSNTIGKVKEP